MTTAAPCSPPPRDAAPGRWKPQSERLPQLRPSTRAWTLHRCTDARSTPGRSARSPSLRSVHLEDCPVPRGPRAPTIAEQGRSARSPSTTATTVSPPALPPSMPASTPTSANEPVQPARPECRVSPSPLGWHASGTRPPMRLDAGKLRIPSVMRVVRPSTPLREMGVGRVRPASRSVRRRITRHRADVMSGAGIGEAQGSSPAGGCHLLCVTPVPARATTRGGAATSRTCWRR